MKLAIPIEEVCTFEYTNYGDEGEVIAASIVSQLPSRVTASKAQVATVLSQ